LISATKSGATIAYQYDGDGNRVSKTVNGTQTRYMVDGNNLTGYAQVVEELDAANTVQVVYTYGLDLISQNRKGFLSWTKSYYGYDATGTTRMLFDDSGTVTDTYTYEAFGTLINRTGTTTNAYLFHGEQFDADLGLYYLRARYMDNNVGRFTTMDGFEGKNEDPNTLHRYCFTPGNPINYADPSGNSFLMGAALMALSVIFGAMLASISCVKHPFGKQRATNISEGGIRFIIKIAPEGFKPKLYNDGDPNNKLPPDTKAERLGNATIGYGHLVHYGPINGTEPQEFKDGITKTRAAELMKNSLSDFVDIVNELVEVPLTQPQFDALVSFSYNAGRGGLKELLQKSGLNDGNYNNVPRDLPTTRIRPSWATNGLVKRRTREANLFRNGTY
jgi:RHS repeat-associated protein